MRALWFKAEFVWGFSARIAGYNKTSPSFLFPPPTTVLGALLSSVAKRLRYSEREYSSLFKKVVQSVYSVSLKPVNLIPNPVTDMVRSIKLDEKEEVSQKFDVPAKGRIIYVSVDGNPPTIEFLILHSSDFISGEDALKINRIGSKESTVSVVDVFETEKVEKAEGFVKTDYSFPLAEGVEMSGDPSDCYAEYYARYWAYEGSIESILLNYYRGSKDAFVKYCIPKMGSNIYVSARGKFSAYRVNLKGMEEVVVGHSG